MKSKVILALLALVFIAALAILGAKAAYGVNVLLLQERSAVSPPATGNPVYHEPLLPYIKTTTNTISGNDLNACVLYYGTMRNLYLSGREDPTACGQFVRSGIIGRIVLIEP